MCDNTHWVFVECLALCQLVAWLCSGDKTDPVSDLGDCQLLGRVGWLDRGVQESGCWE